MAHDQWIINIEAPAHRKYALATFHQNHKYIHVSLIAAPGPEAAPEPAVATEPAAAPKSETKAAARLVPLENKLIDLLRDAVQAEEDDTNEVFDDYDNYDDGWDKCHQLTEKATNEMMRLAGNLF